jgi:hypothetical protein
VVAVAVKLRLTTAVVALLILLPFLLPTPHPEARLFSDGWGATSYIDPNFCITQIDGQPTRMALFAKAPAVAQVVDRLALALQYLFWGVLLPVLALAVVLRVGARHPTLLTFGLLGFAPAACQWSFHPGFVLLRQTIAEALLALIALSESSFVWIDAATLALWLSGGTLLLGGGVFWAVRGAARLAGLDERRLTTALVPLAAITLFMGLTLQTALYLRGEGVNLDWLPGARVGLIALAVAMSAWLGWREIHKVGAGGTAPKLLAGLVWLIPLLTTAAMWWLAFFRWIDRFHV